MSPWVYWAFAMLIILTASALVAGLTCLIDELFWRKRGKK